jgi:hypothetical protein
MTRLVRASTESLEDAASITALIVTGTCENEVEPDSDDPPAFAIDAPM